MNKVKIATVNGEAICFIEQDIETFKSMDWAKIYQEDSPSSEWFWLQVKHVVLLQTHEERESHEETVPGEDVVGQVFR